MIEQGPRRNNVTAGITQRAISDLQFRHELLQSPKQVLQQELGIEIPDTIDIQVIEETPASFVLVLPPPDIQANQELSTAELDAVAGGGWGPTADPNNPNTEGYCGT